MDVSQRGEHEPIVSIVGEKVALGPIHRDLLPLYLKWFNDFEYLSTTSQMRPMTWEALEGHFKHSSTAENEIHFAIYERETMRPIGGTALTDITARTATFSIGIGEKDCWGKGYGTEATRLTLDYGFNALGLHNIMLTVYSYNERGVHAYTKAGFRVFGRRRQAIWRGGRAYDVVYMDCLATEFQGSVLRGLLADK